MSKVNFCKTSTGYQVIMYMKGIVITIQINFIFFKATNIADTILNSDNLRAMIGTRKTTGGIY